MSAIFGIFHRDKRPVERQQLNLMSAAMSHRAVDGQATIELDNTGLGHLMLQTTPQSLFEQLPYVDEHSAMSITCDARLDNRDELIAQLLPHMGPVSNIPDSLVLLRAFQKWGEKMPEHLLGDYVFAIWIPNNQSLFLVRDHMGVKPLHYYCDDKVCVFASEVQAIHAALTSRLSVNKNRVADYLLGHEPYDFVSTFHNNVWRLPPAHSLMITKHRADKRCYWQPDIQVSAERPDQEYIEEFTELLEKSVTARLVSSTPIGCLLSGGIDSATVLAIANKGNGGNIHSYSGVSSDPDCLETSSIKSVLAHQGSPSEQITRDELTGMQSEMRFCFSRLDDPFASCLTLLIALYKRASLANQRVVLDGMEGDLVISLTRGYPAILMREGKWLSGLSELNGMVANGFTELSSGRLVLRTLAGAVAPAWLKELRLRSGAATQISNQLKDSLLSDNMIANEAIVNRCRNYPGTRVRPHRTLTEQHLWWNQQPFFAVALERYDRIAGVCGVESRHPLLDKRLVEFCLNLPWQLKVKRGWSKWILRQSMQTLLPQSVVWRKDKPNLGREFNIQWMINNWSEFRATTKETMPLWSAYADQRRVLAYFESHAYNPITTPASGPLDMYFLAAWLNRFG